MCVLYTALKLHFTPGKYDFFHYQGKVNLTPEKYEHRKDRWFFHKLAKEYPDRDTAVFFLAANFFSNTARWVRDLLSEDAHTAYKEKLRVKESLMYIIAGDLEVMLPSHESHLYEKMKSLVKVEDGQRPRLLEMVSHNEIHVETLIALDAAVGFMDIWEKKLNDSILFPIFKHTCYAYRPFLGIDVKKVREMLKNRLTG